MVCRWHPGRSCHRLELFATIRYTPIRRPYQPLVEHSWELARGRGLRSAGEGEAEGLLIDMAEVWERFVLHCAERVRETGEQVVHEASVRGSERRLYRSRVSADVSMGRLLPDVLIHRGGEVRAVLDAKYKLITDRPEAPQGVSREDRYQLAGYLSRFGDGDVIGGLVYPAELNEEGNELPPDQWTRSTAEAEGPWSGPDDIPAVFTRISFDKKRAAARLRQLLDTASMERR